MEVKNPERVPARLCNMNVDTVSYISGWAGVKWSRKCCLCPEPSGRDELYIPKQLAEALMQPNKGLL